MPAKHESPLTIVVSNTTQPSYSIDLDLPNFNEPLISPYKLHTLFTTSYSPMSSSSDTPAAIALAPAKKSRYLSNAPPPLQLKVSSHRPRSNSSSHRISREKLRASMQSFKSGGPLTPLTARAKTYHKKERHRRRLLKLKRTFGDEVPIEVINSSLLSGSTAEDMKELSVLGPQTPRLPRLPSPCLASAAYGSQKHSPPLLKRHKKGILTSLTAVRPTPTSTKIRGQVSQEKPSPVPSPPVILISANDEISSSDVDEAPFTSTSARPLLHDTTEENQGQWPRTPFSHAFTPTTIHLLPAPKTRESTAKRSERRQGWSGEWNQPDIQDVIKRLRNMQ